MLCSWVVCIVTRDLGEFLMDHAVGKYLGLVLSLLELTQNNPSSKGLQPIEACGWSCHYSMGVVLPSSSEQPYGCRVAAFFNLPQSHCPSHSSACHSKTRALLAPADGKEEQEGRLGTIMATAGVGLLGTPRAKPCTWASTPGGTLGTATGTKGLRDQAWPGNSSVRCGPVLASLHFSHCSLLIVTVAKTLVLPTPLFVPRKKCGQQARFKTVWKVDLSFISDSFCRSDLWLEMFENGIFHFTQK